MNKKTIYIIASTAIVTFLMTVGAYAILKNQLNTVEDEVMAKEILSQHSKLTSCQNDLKRALEELEEKN